MDGYLKVLKGWMTHEPETICFRLASWIAEIFLKYSML
jgi:hypothetical protein